MVYVAYTLGPLNTPGIIRRHAHDVYLGMCPIKWLLLRIYANVLACFSETSRTVRVRNSKGHGLASFNVYWIRQHAQSQPEVHAREKHHKLLLPHFSYSPSSHWILHAPSARLRTPMDPVIWSGHTWRANIRAPVANSFSQCRSEC